MNSVAAVVEIAVNLTSRATGRASILKVPCNRRPHINPACDQSRLLKRAIITSPRIRAPSNSQSLCVRPSSQSGIPLLFCRCRYVDATEFVPRRHIKHHHKRKGQIAFNRSNGAGPYIFISTRSPTPASFKESRQQSDASDYLRKLVLHVRSSSVAS